MPVEIDPAPSSEVSPRGGNSAPLPPPWSVRPVVLTLLGVLVVAGVLVFVLDHRSLLHRTELTICIVAAALFMFLAAGLYRGSRVQEETLDPPEPAES